MDTRADVYALGLVLFLLLCGEVAGGTPPAPRTPASMLEHRRRHWPVASLAVGATPHAAKHAARRGTDAAGLRRALHGDLDRILQKALAFDREERYSTPAELAADLGRALRHEPKAARPKSSLYLLRKFARRHRAWVGAGVAVALTLAVGVVAEVRQRLRAQTEWAKSQSVAAFLESVLTAPRKTGRGYTVVEARHEAARRLDTDFPQPGEAKAILESTIGVALGLLGDLEDGERLVRRAGDERVVVDAARCGDAGSSGPVSGGTPLCLASEDDGDKTADDAEDTPPAIAAWLGEAASSYALVSCRCRRRVSVAMTSKPDPTRIRELGSGTGLVAGPDSPPPLGLSF